MKSRLREADHAGLKQIEFPASVHLAFDQLQLADLPFGLAVGPRRRDCSRHGGLILRDPVGESGNEAAFRPFDPFIEFSERLSANDAMEVDDDFAGFDEECDVLIAEGTDPEDRDEHQFFVPKRARWSEIQKTATGYVSDATCNFGNMTTVSHTEVTGDFNSAYTVKVTSHREGGPAGVARDSVMTLEAKWLGACKADQKAGDIVMSGGLKMNVKDMEKLKGLMPK